MRFLGHDPDAGYSGSAGEEDAPGDPVYRDLSIVCHVTLSFEFGRIARLIAD